jgi:hypothetical protein
MGELVRARRDTKKSAEPNAMPSAKPTSVGLMMLVDKQLRTEHPLQLPDVERDSRLAYAEMRGRC